MTVPQLAAATGLAEREVDALLWGSPQSFVWQPGHKWGLKSSKRRPGSVDSAKVEVVDSKSELLAAKPAKDLGARTLSNGLTIQFRRRALDTDAFFAVKSSGNTIELTLNSTHEIFDYLPIPYDDDDSDHSPYRELVETLLSAWALHEDGASTPSARRQLVDDRLFWGRRAIEILRE
ncbi:hypothetical protein [Nocardioides coralli]|uniref:hypothetical protein n=1 Tax=Nocardioides coralli TaxID=2872154 RepID=UPI001CA441AE|nr:hypothetical protein [Nocardioides coralli]QZY29685.1 hypothetical protein K6T13_03050 [Nocardioides coralli]